MDAHAVNCPVTVPSDGENGWLASMCSDAALVAVERAIAEVGVIEPDAAEALERILATSIEPAIRNVLVTMATPDIALQPIVHLEGGTVIGYEALARFGEGTGTADAFRNAAEHGMQVEIELLALVAALARLHEIPAGVFLGVNISAEALTDHRVTDALLGVQTRRLVIELTQQSKITDIASVLSSFRSLQASGALICVDQAGVGFFTGQRLLELEPEVVKIARALIDRCDLDVYAEQQVRELVTVCRRIGALSIAIGVERPEQRDLLKRIGVDAVQGHLVGKPSLDFEVASHLATA